MILIILHLTSFRGYSGEKVRIACVGNSITYGAKIENREENSYPAQLGSMLGENYDVRNFGRNGATLLREGDLPYWDTKEYKRALAFNPDLVFIKLGTNDTKPQNRIYLDDEFIKNYKDLITSFKKLSSDPRIVLLVPVPVFSTDTTGITSIVLTEKIIPMVRQVAYETDSEVVNLYNLLIESLGMFPDSVHPNAAGAKVISRRLHEFVKMETEPSFDLSGKLPEEATLFNFYGFQGHSFIFGVRDAKVVVPKETAPGHPWVWRSRFWGHEPQTDIALLERGFHIAYCDVAELFGNDEAISIWDNFYQMLTHADLSKKAVMEGMSRGGMYIYRWAGKYPERVSAIYADAPVLDMKSWPGGGGQREKNIDNWEIFKKDFGFQTEEEAISFKGNPLDLADKIAKAGFPMLHVVGDADGVVPVSENTEPFEQKINKAGGDIKVIHKPGIGHHPHSLPNPKPIIDFVLMATDYQAKQDMIPQSSVCDKQTECEKIECKLWYEQPASEWNEALPVGNGRLGAMVFGGIETERIQLNEESLWAGSPMNNNNPKALENLSKLRELILDDKLDEATKLAEVSLLGTPPRIRSYQTLGDLFLDFGTREIGEYKRELDLNEGICRITYSSEGVIFTEEVLASAPDNLIAIYLKVSSKGALNFTARLERQEDAIVKNEGDDMLILEGQIIDEDDPLRGEGGAHMRFGAYLKAIPKGGEVSSEGNKLRISSANEVILLLTAATDYNLETLNFDRSIDPFESCENILSRTKGKDYGQIKNSHLDEYQSMFNRVQFDLGGHELDTLPTDKRLELVKEGTDDPGLIAIYFQYGRYLLMGSSRNPGVLPANLQGIWCKDFTAPWNSDYHTNINLQMNYWPAEVTNLSETALPLIKLVDQLRRPGSITAQEMYGANGWTMHHTTDIFGRTGLMDGIQWGTFPMGGPWMTFPVYRHFEFTGDKKYLKDNAYPILKGAASFVMDFLVVDSEGHLVTAPSNSPENSYYLPGTDKEFRMTYGSTIDVQVITELFHNCIEATEILEVDRPFADSLKTVLQKLPPIKISKTTGGIQEWIKDYEEAKPGHRHMSHLLGLYPGTQINPSTPELFEAAKNTITRRLDNGGGHTGWSRAWIINFYARLQDGEKSWYHLNELLRKSTLSNLFDNHPPFQIDGNFGGTASIAEMLLQSHEGDTIRLLPALPKAWEKGNMAGLKARDGITIDIYWEQNRLIKALLTSGQNKKVYVLYEGEAVQVNLNEGKAFEFKPPHEESNR